jgi:hypothetical protein
MYTFLPLPLPQYQSNVDPLSIAVSLTLCSVVPLQLMMGMAKTATM